MGVLGVLLGGVWVGYEQVEGYLGFTGGVDLGVVGVFGCYLGVLGVWRGYWCSWGCVLVCLGVIWGGGGILVTGGVGVSRCYMGVCGV